MKKTIFSISIISFVILFIATVASAQKNNEDTDRRLSQYMHDVRNRKSISLEEAKKIHGSDPQMILELLKKYYEDPSDRVRHEAILLARRIAKQKPDPGIRQEVLTRLINGLSDPSPLVHQYAGEFLLDFKSDEFTQAHKSVIKHLLNKEKPTHDLLLIVGVAGMKDETARLEKLLIDETKYETGNHVGKWYGTVGWAARLARARMGNKADIDRAIKVVESETDPDSRIFLLKYLAYIRQPEVIEILKKYLDSDEATPKRSIDVLQMPYAQIGIDLLADSIVNFPVTKREAGLYSKSDIELARKWMRNKENWINSIRR
jgi:hypothetical protein